MDAVRRLRQVEKLLFAVGATLAVGTVGFRLSLHEPWFQSFYRAVITATLTGLDSVPPSNSARALSIVMVIAGLTIIAYAGAVIVEAIAGGLFSGVVAERRRERAIESLTDHYIICGYGRVGQRVADEFRATGEKFVVIDLNDDAIAVAEGHGDLFIQGNATEDEDLAQAGLQRAKGIVVASDSDADNLYVVLSARAVRPDLQIVARGSDEDAAKKLKLAGADRVVLPYTSAGRTMANLVLRPQVTEFLDTVTTATGPDLHMAEIQVDGACAQAGKTIREVRVRHETGALIVALRRHDGTFETTPEPDETIEPGDVIVGVGTSDELQKLEELFSVGG
ncbi:MAG TPA: TrkA family potassium uptake protein [Gaiellaceae bacterium]|nr:TrkA family potassium uptake protein [Gaiellaceae bacterium]